ncbi:hypothetical protein DM02DRAFT_672733 [Periconia macrospinosa]|uniref:F-box domain-containing protein n=1 Tax=Periconia macrospinosa TaxID=97972 RepID=A0A2V1DMA5_9PLEO|nr:hypothetical protein DM02DRAFT_672733 [Periconia macrospinosa]
MPFFEEPKEPGRNVAAKQSANSIRKQRESPFLRLPAELRNKIYSYVNEAECWHGTVLHRTRPGIFARANTSYPRNLALVCHQLRAETTDLPYTFKSSLYGGMFYSDKSRVKVIRLRMEQKSAWGWKHLSCKESRLRAIQSVHHNTWRAVPYIQTLERLIVCVEMADIDDDVPANGIGWTPTKMVVQNEWEEITTTTVHRLGQRPDIKVLFEYECV